VIIVIGIIFIEESYPPVLLSRKADKIRHETKNWAIHSKSQENGQSLQQLARKYGILPFEMLVDPICFFMNLYAAFVYGIIYLHVAEF
jgi:hypothetical protein